MHLRLVYADPQFFDSSSTGFLEMLHYTSCQSSIKLITRLYYILMM